MLAGCMDKVRGWSVYLCCLLSLMVGNSALAQVVLPDTGVDVPGHITALVTALGVIAGAAVAAWAAFFAIRKGLRWVNRVG